MRVSKERGTLSLVDGGSERLVDFVVEWWQAYAARQLAPRTEKLYAGILDKHVLPRLGDLRLRELRPSLIDGFAVDLRSSGVGEETIRKSLAILQTCLQRAVLHDRLASNPVAAVRKPSQARSRVIEPLAPERVERMRSHLLAQGRVDDAALVSVLAYAGLRPGEGSRAHLERRPGPHARGQQAREPRHGYRRGEIFAPFRARRHDAGRFAR